MDGETGGKVRLPPVAQVGIVVKDIEKVMEFYSSTFGIGPWEIREGESRQVQKDDQTYRYKPRVAFADLGPITLELFEVREGRSPIHSEFLERRGEGVHHLGFYVSDEEKEEIIAGLAEIGIGVVQGGRSKTGSNAFLDTEKTGGVFFELIARATD